jgi:uncharacterized protein YcfJ
MKLKENSLGEIILQQAVKERARRIAQNSDAAMARAAKAEDNRRKTAIAAFTSGGAALGGTAGAVSGTPAGVLAGTAAGAAVGNYVGRKLYREGLDKPTLSPVKLAKKHRVPLKTIKRQLKIGTKVEHEHTTDDATARKIAAAHVGEKPDYYTRLKKVEETTLSEKNWEKYWLKKSIKKATKNSAAHKSANKAKDK